MSAHHPSRRRKGRDPPGSSRCATCAVSAASVASAPAGSTTARRMRDPPLLEMQNECAELKLRAERQAGELLAAMPLEARSHDATHLHEIGVNKHQSSRWQQLASLPEAEFDAYIAAAPRAGVLRPPPGRRVRQRAANASAANGALPYVDLRTACCCQEPLRRV
jgi:hypothetical protein